ncbi:MAG: lipocalin-like domain-containing protein [Muribaculaceae bacterium]|nr:lipocalin-like domain-containing protein [Muribaculaceae bacterium]
MKARTLSTLAACALLLLLQACTQNNGHIGHLFGSWVLDGRTADGTEIPLPEGMEAYMSFQSDIVRMLTVKDTYTVEDESYASWTEEGDNLIVDCTHTSDNDSWQHRVPSWLYPAEDFITFRISRLDGSRLILVRDVDGVDYVYTFSKTW